jgi:predicted PurR-regulated permease PerM
MDLRTGADRSDRRDDNGRAAQRPRAPVPPEEPSLLHASLPLVWRSGAQAATIGIFVIMLIAALDLARSVLLPTASAFVIALMLGPLSARADRHRVPALLTAFVLWLLVVGVFYGLIVLLSAPAVEWIGKAPEIAHRIQEKLIVFDRPLEALRDVRTALLPPDEAGKGVGFDIMTIITPAVGIVTPAIGQLIIFFGALFFMLLGRNHFRQLIVAFFSGRQARLRTLKVMNAIEQRLTGYLSVVAVINVGVGVAAGLVAWMVGLPDPIAWGVLGFVLNFVPYLGALLMELAMFLVGLVTFPTLSHALVAPLMYLAVNIVEGHFITPGVVGRWFTLNPLIVFLSLVFWTWLWGPVGAFLSVPLLLMGVVALVHLFPKHEPDLPD